MRIGIDIRCLVEGKISGVEEYLIRTLKELFEKDTHNEYVLFFNSFTGNRTNLQWLRAYPKVEIRDFRFPNKLLNLLIWLTGWPKIDVLIGGVDVFFAPNIGFLSVSKSCRKILTIHDLSFERFPETFSWKRRLWHFFINPRKLCHQFDHILAVSESSKQDLISLYRLPESKISVSFPRLEEQILLPDDLSRQKKEAVCQKYQLREKFILYLGTIEPRKNIISLISAFENLKKEEKWSDYQLVIAGARGWKCEKIYGRYVKSLWQKDIVFTDFVQVEEKPYLYSLCQVFVYPSFFEGFGFPPVEAMAAGVPVISSNVSSLPEILGDAAILVDPYRPFEITLALKLLLENESIKQNYIQRGRERVHFLNTLNRPSLLAIINKLR